MSSDPTTCFIKASKHALESRRSLRSEKPKAQLHETCAVPCSATTPKGISNCQAHCHQAMAMTCQAIHAISYQEERGHVRQLAEDSSWEHLAKVNEANRSSRKIYIYISMHICAPWLINVSKDYFSYIRCIPNLLKKSKDVTALKTTYFEWNYVASHMEFNNEPVLKVSF